MRSPSLDQLILLPAPQALERWFDGWNYGILRWVLAVGIPLTALATIVEASDGQPAAAAAWGAMAVVLLTLALLRKSRFFERNFRLLLLISVGTLILGLALVARGPGAAYGLAGYLVPLLLLFLRVRPGEHLILLGLAEGLAAWQIARGELASTAGGQVGMLVGLAIWAAVTLGIASRSRQSRARSFLGEWNQTRDREAERHRMREELTDARQIQLSMLPRRPPNVSWVDIASASMPATEVGGDYFDYIVLDPERLAVVVGDVAGHGLASGLLLAAIRGGLHLLQDDLAEPLVALQKLDRMVQEVAPRRMYVTLQIAVLDHQERRLTVVSAGHPPALHLRAVDRTVSALGESATPLGTRLRSRLQPAVAELAEEDIVLLYSDGLVEVTDASGEAFGEDRLRRTLGKSAAADGSARQVRDNVLDAVTFFKGDVAARDDLTVVVVKFAGTAAAGRSDPATPPARPSRVSAGGGSVGLSSLDRPTCSLSPSSRG